MAIVIGTTMYYLVINFQVFQLICLHNFFQTALLIMLIAHAHYRDLLRFHCAEIALIYQQ